MAKKSEYYQADEVHRSNPDLRNPSSTTRVGVLNTQTDVSTPSFQHANCKDDSERGISTMDFAMLDADNHYYEAEDAFTRYASERMRAERYVRWLAEGDGKRRRLFFGAREANVIGNPTFNPITRPGVFHETLKNLEAGLDRSAPAYGELVPIDPAYRDRDARLTTMDRQGVEKALLFPTLGVTLEGILSDDGDMLYQCFHAFNRWIDDEWGFLPGSDLCSAVFDAVRSR